MSIYAAFSVYLLGILFMALGVYRLWAEMLRPRWVNWALLPGTVVAEMAFIFGSLITGGEVRRARLMGGGDSRGGRSAAPGAGDAEPTAEAAPRLRLVGPVIAAACCLAACGAGILAARSLLGGPVIDQLNARLPEAMPTTAAGFWLQAIDHVNLLRRAAQICLELRWLDWHVPVFVYLSVCLSIRLAPVRRPLRPTLIAVVLIAAVIALVGLPWQRFRDALRADLWPLVTYVWTALLGLLAVSLIIRGAVGLTRALLEKDQQN